MTRTTSTVIAIVLLVAGLSACRDPQTSQASAPAVEPAPPAPPPPPFPTDDAVLDVVRFEAVTGAPSAATADPMADLDADPGDGEVDGDVADGASGSGAGSADGGPETGPEVVDLAEAARRPGPNPLIIPPDARLELELWQRLVDFRVRLVDASDRLVPFDIEAGQVSVRSAERPEPGGTWIRVTPKAPLTPGTGYVLKVEGEISDRVEDGDGRRFDDLVLTLKTSGDKPPPPPRKRLRRGSRRRR